MSKSDNPRSFETVRGCGVRQAGKLYLVGSGLGYECPALPLIFKGCETCGYEPPQYRDFQWVNKSYIRHIKPPTGQACIPTCPVCYPGTNDQDRYGLMFVGRKFYTPVEFIAESVKMEVSKAIKQIPKDLVLGETWVLLAHPDAVVDKHDALYIGLYNEWVSRGIDEGKPEPKPPTYPGVFFGFIPQRVEMLVYESEATREYLDSLEKKGITPVVVPDKYDAHTPRRRAYKGRGNL